MACPAPELIALRLWFHRPVGSLAHSPFYHSCALQPPPLLGVVGSSAGDSRAPSRVEGLVDDMRREEDAKLQEDRRWVP